MNSDAEGLRPTGTVPKRDGQPNVFVFGCSYTYGWFLDDEQTYAWLLQESLPESNVYNFAQPGYGTHHALLRLTEQLRLGRIPKACVFSYIPTMPDGPFGHPDRNVANPLFIYLIAAQSEYAEQIGTMSFPRAHVSVEGLCSISYVPMDLRGLADVPREAYAVDRVHTHFVTKHLVDAIMHLSQQYGFTAIWAKMRSGALDTIESYLYERHGVTMVDCVLPLEEDLTYRVSKGDTHPNAMSQRIYHDRLVDPLRSAIACAAV